MVSPRLQLCENLGLLIEVDRDRTSRTSEHWRDHQIAVTSVLSPLRRRRFAYCGKMQFVGTEHTCDLLALVAALFPDRMLALVMGEVERMANDPLPVDQRPPRIAALKRELDELHRVEEALIAAAIAAGHSVHRSPSVPPEAVLGVRVADRVSRAA